MLVHEVCNLFLSHCQYNKQLSIHTIRAYKQDLACFNKLTKVQEVQNFDKNQLKYYVSQLHQMGLGARTVKRRVACLKSMFKWLELEDIIIVNPFHKADISLKIPKQLPRNIPKSNLRKILKSARAALNLEKEDSYTASKLKELIVKPKQLNKLTSLLVVELLFSTGIRVSELVNINLLHISIVEKKILILGKGQRERFVFLTNKEIADLVNAYIIVRGITNPNHDYLLVNSRGKPASSHFIRKLLRQESDAAKVDKVTPHMYRHSAACQLLESGVDIRYVQRLLGHQSILTTQLYTHVNDNVLQRKIAKANTRSSIT
ncbi:tyrosine-type recombinase/integrase [Pseudoalteromonas sp. MMG013]|uniref:tyrosine-type recombinase/integrase n=1 Tax=Pseudoalteromonas sp. MMG013 TaxID=2822687 RepID=UPI001B36295A|nr:tyrosine-type recombinase/integrase [Pseudoalteromonas sp. MMG013]MBQ4864135.1 tyrosine-type recombinase/integrase [Pseudoalteromonas sp. MMG013]